MPIRTLKGETMRKGHAETYYTGVDRTPPTKYDEQTKVHIIAPANLHGTIKLAPNKLRSRMKNLKELRTFYTVWLDEALPNGEEVVFFQLRRIRIVKV